MPSHPLTNFEIQKYYQRKPKFNNVDISLESLVTHWVAIYVENNVATYFDSIGDKHFP